MKKKGKTMNAFIFEVLFPSYLIYQKISTTNFKGLCCGHTQL